MGLSLRVLLVHGIFLFDLSKIYVVIFFLQKCHPAAGSFGGKELPPDEPAVRSLAHGPWNLPSFHPAVAPYRQKIGGKCYRRATARL